MTYEQIILDAFDQLNPYYNSELAKKKTKKIDSSLSSEYMGIKASLGASMVEETALKAVRALPPQLTAQRLARFIGEARCCWVLEDFHKISASEKKPLAETMKVFMDAAIDFLEPKLVFLGAVATAREVVAYDSEMRGRVAEIEVPLMEENELEEIIKLGQARLNVTFPRNIKKKIVKYSNGIARVCHQLALNTCDAHGLHQTASGSVPEKLTVKDFNKAVENYVTDESDSLQELFDRALRQTRKRKYNNCKLILQTLALSDDPKGLTKGELAEAIRKEEPNYPPGNLTRYLDELKSEKRSSILLLDVVSGRYDYSNPFYKTFARLVFARERDEVLSVDGALGSVEISSKIWKILSHAAANVAISMK